MNHGTHVPVRLCMGCGERAPQGELLRVSIGCDGTLTVTRLRTHRGRSGYLHRHAPCWERFAARKGVVRSLGCSVDRTARTALVQELKRHAANAITE